ncbi:hypothetical protein TSOC_011823 [Tetrabaena socialis]|uniref:Uncharacterized protein n=1 Tax=Tetrabaena socialis TaxID=47790 RepID=A0A2J7ZPM9_9CHLO|nr:hypothetical protein TSOC_011823 [Tetrabaena socialis]|eukprot:PNH02220.1 hypothetical protein TSOC_011823 [Tetrabaena socialis]
MKCSGRANVPRSGLPRSSGRLAAKAASSDLAPLLPKRSATSCSASCSHGSSPAAAAAWPTAAFFTLSGEIQAALGTETSTSPGCASAVAMRTGLSVRMSADSDARSSLAPLLRAQAMAASTEAALATAAFMKSLKMGSMGREGTGMGKFRVALDSVVRTAVPGARADVTELLGLIRSKEVTPGDALR